MPYELVELTADRSYAIVSLDRPQNMLHVTDLRDLLLLNQRITDFAHTLTPDRTLDQPLPKYTDLITVAEAHNLAKSQGLAMPRATVKSAYYRNTIPTAFQQGSRWLAPREDVLLWIRSHAGRQ